jgi:hypothetical protein
VRFFVGAGFPFLVRAGMGWCYGIDVDVGLVEGVECFVGIGKVFAT